MECRRAGSIALASDAMTSRTIMRIDLRAGGQVCGPCQFRRFTLSPRPRRIGVQRTMKRHLLHLIVRAIAAGAGMRFAFGPGEFTRAAQRFEIRDEVARFL